jgi:vancomycin resistance protein VanJ
MRPLGPGIPASPRRCTPATILLTRAHGLCLLLLLVLRFGVAERSGATFVCNAMLFYAVTSTLWLLPVAVVGRRTDTWLIVGSGATIWSVLWGSLLLPARQTQVPPGPRIRVMSYNVLGSNFNTASVVRILRDSSPDVAVLQELNPENAAAVERELSDRYPYRWLDARAGVTGGGIVSRIPFREAPIGALGQVSWVGKPMAITFPLGGRDVTLLRMHAFSGPANTSVRNAEAAAIAGYAAAHRGPLIVAGDLNATDQNSAYRAITSRLVDSWREAGWGFGHTFPGDPTGPGSRPVILGIAVPRWLVRIDYVFHSPELAAISAETLPSDGASDHRPILATLSLR